MKRNISSISLALLTIALTACGGGGGGDSGTSTGPTGNVPSGPTTQSVSLTGLSLRTTDILATTQPTTKTAALFLHGLDKASSRLGSMFMGTAMADNCGTLCQPAYPPANMPAQQLLTARLGSAGALASIAPVFSATNASAVKCDFTNVGVKVNSIWWLDVKSQNALVNLSVPTSVDSSCNLTYTTGDYVVFGTGQAVALNQDVIGDISDMIPAGDQGFNSSGNAIYLSKSTGLVRELQITTAGVISRVDLTTTSQPTCSRAGAFSGQVAYDGNYLVGNASGFSGLLIYKKGDTAFKMIRDANQTLNTPCTTSVTMDDAKQFIVFQNSSAYVVDAVNATESVWAKYAQQAPQSLIKFTGRSGSIIGGDRCNYWDYSKATETTIYAAPAVQSWNLPYAGDATDMITPMSVSPRYSRVSEGYAYCVSAAMNWFIRQDLTTGNLVNVSLDPLGYIATGYQVFSDRAYATVTNTANSNVEYVEIDFTTGKAKYLGTITAGGREVVSLMKAANGG